MRASRRIAKQIAGSVLERDTASILSQIVRSSLERESISYRDRPRRGPLPSHAKLVDFIPDFGRDAHELYGVAKEAPFVVSLIYDVIPFDKESDPLVEPHAYSRLRERNILPEGFSFKDNEDLRKSLSLFITRSVRGKIEDDVTSSESLLTQGKVLKFSDSDFIAYCKVFSQLFLKGEGTMYPVSVVVLPKEFDFDPDKFGPAGEDRYKVHKKRERLHKEKFTPTAPKEAPQAVLSKKDSMELAFTALMRVHDVADIFRTRVGTDKELRSYDIEKIFVSLRAFLKERPDLNVFTEDEFLQYVLIGRWRG